MLVFECTDNIYTVISRNVCTDVADILLVTDILLHIYFLILYMQPNSTCGISKYYINSGVCKDSATGSSTQQTLTGNTMLVIRNLSSLTTFSVTSEDQNNNTMCQSFSEKFRIHMIYLHNIVCLISLQA